MANRSKKRQVVAIIAMCIVSIACANPLPTRVSGTVPTVEESTSVGANRAISPMPPDPTRWQAVPCEECE
jgi:hypothetical protein